MLDNILSLGAVRPQGLINNNPKLLEANKNIQQNLKDADKDQKEELYQKAKELNDKYKLGFTDQYLRNNIANAMLLSSAQSIYNQVVNAYDNYLKVIDMFESARELIAQYPLGIDENWAWDNILLKDYDTAVSNYNKLLDMVEEYKQKYSFNFDFPSPQTTESDNSNLLIWLLLPFSVLVAKNMFNKNKHTKR